MSYLGSGQGRSESCVSHSRMRVAAFRSCFVRLQGGSPLHGRPKEASPCISGRPFGGLPTRASGDLEGWRGTMGVVDRMFGMHCCLMGCESYARRRFVQKSHHVGSTSLLRKNVALWRERARSWPPVCCANGKASVDFVMRNPSCLLFSTSSTKIQSTYISHMNGTAVSRPRVAYTNRMSEIDDEYSG